MYEFFNTIFVSSHMYPDNPERTQVIVCSMNMDTARNLTHNLFRPKCVPTPCTRPQWRGHFHPGSNLISTVYQCSNTIIPPDTDAPRTMHGCRILLNMHPWKEGSLEAGSNDINRLDLGADLKFESGWPINKKLIQLKRKHVSCVFQLKSFEIYNRSLYLQTRENELCTKYKYFENINIMTIIW